MDGSRTDDDATRHGRPGTPAIASGGSPAATASPAPTPPPGAETRSVIRVDRRLVPPGPHPLIAPTLARPGEGPGSPSHHAGRDASRPEFPPLLHAITYHPEDDRRCRRSAPEEGTCHGLRPVLRPEGKSVSAVLLAVGLAVASVPRDGIDPEAIEAAADRPIPGCHPELMGFRFPDPGDYPLQGMPWIKSREDLIAHLHPGRGPGRWCAATSRGRRRS